MSKVLIGNIKGPKGDPGPEGPQGPEGKQGPTGLVNADGAIEFEDYTEEGAEVPLPDEALKEIISGKSLKSVISHIKAFLMGVGSTVPEIIGDKFSDSKGYVVGDYAIKDDVLYHFIADKAAGAWDETTVEPTTVTKEFQDLNVNMEWKLLGRKTSSSAGTIIQIPIPIDLEFAELCVTLESSNAGNYIFSLPKQALTPTKGIRQGFYSSANLTGFCSITVSTSTIQSGSYNQVGVVAKDVVMTAYYR